MVCVLTSVSPHRKKMLHFKEEVVHSGAFPYLICVCVSQMQIEEKKDYPIADCPIGLKNP